MHCAWGQCSFCTGYSPLVSCTTVPKWNDEFSMSGRHTLQFYSFHIVACRDSGVVLSHSFDWGGGGGTNIFWVGVCCWDSETLTLNQIKFSCILQPYTRLKTKIAYPIPDFLFSRKLVTITVQPKQNLLCVQQQPKHIF